MILTNMNNKIISIHAPRTGSDAHTTSISGLNGHFNPRSPHGERPETLTAEYNPIDFNPRSPHGERRTQNQSGL